MRGTGKVEGTLLRRNMGAHTAEVGGYPNDVREEAEAFRSPYDGKGTLRERYRFLCSNRARERVGGCRDHAMSFPEN